MVYGIFPQGLNLSGNDTLQRMTTFRPNLVPREGGRDRNEVALSFIEWTMPLYENDLDPFHKRLPIY